MKRVVQWGRPVKERGNEVRTSKCGRYRIVKRSMASSRNGCWNAKEYDPQKANGSSWVRLTRFPYDRLGDALDFIESDNDPNWEADD